MNSNIKIYETLEQGTDEWLEVRRGKITASIVKSLLTGKFAISKNAQIKLLAFQLASERITGRVQEKFETFDMKRGHIEEELARELYREHYAPVKEVGFIENTALGFSPDGLVGDDGFIEIKSRQPKFQVQTFYENEVPDEYMCQMQTGLIVTERDWCDYVQYSNGMPLFVKRVTRNEEIITNILIAVSMFETQIRDIVSTYQANLGDAPVADYIKDFFNTGAGEFDFDPFSDVPDLTQKGE